MASTVAYSEQPIATTPLMQQLADQTRAGLLKLGSLTKSAAQTATDGALKLATWAKDFFQTVMQQCSFALARGMQFGQQQVSLLKAWVAANPETTNALKLGGVGFLAGFVIASLAKKIFAGKSTTPPASRPPSTT